MGKIKIHEIAKKLQLSSKEVLDIAKTLNINVTSHLSGVDENQAKQIEQALKNKTSIANDEKQNKQAKKVETKNKEKQIIKKEPKKEEKAPVIIRREVIISRRRRKRKEKRRSKKGREEK